MSVLDSWPPNSFHSANFTYFFFLMLRLRSNPYSIKQQCCSGGNECELKEFEGVLSPLQRYKKTIPSTYTLQGKLRKFHNAVNIWNFYHKYQFYLEISTLKKISVRHFKVIELENYQPDAFGKELS